jgi:hypothetical protein
VDDAQDGVELGPGLRGGAAVAGRLGMLEDLGERVPGDAGLAAGGALAGAVDEDATADLGPVVPVGEPPGTSRRRAGDGAEPPSSLTRSLRGEPGAPRFLTDRRSPASATFFRRPSH